MIIFIDGRTDTRPLASQDKAHVELPYDLIMIFKGNSDAAISDNQLDYQLELTETDWGSGKDFYPSIMNLYIWITAAFMANAKEGFMVELVEVTGGVEGVPHFKKTYDNQEAVVMQGSSTNHYIAVTEPIWGNKINSGNTLRINFSNFVGIAIPKNKLIIYISGLAV